MQFAHVQFPLSIFSLYDVAILQQAANAVAHVGSSYFGSSITEGFAQTRSVSTKIIREVEDWDALTTKVLMATWGAPRSAMPHSVPMLQERLEVAPHGALVLTRVNGYSAENERIYFTAPPSAEAKSAFAAMMEARRRVLTMIRPGVSCSVRNYLNWMARIPPQLAHWFDPSSESAISL